MDDEGLVPSEEQEAKRKLIIDMLKKVIFLAKRKKRINLFML